MGRRSKIFAKSKEELTADNELKDVLQKIEDAEAKRDAIYQTVKDFRVDAVTAEAAEEKMRKYTDAIKRYNKRKAELEKEIQWYEQKKRS
jgi:uncharacterized protein (UPF0335 family)